MVSVCPAGKMEAFKMNQGTVKFWWKKVLGAGGFERGWFCAYTSPVGGRGQARPLACSAPCAPRPRRLARSRMRAAFASGPLRPRRPTTAMPPTRDCNAFVDPMWIRSVCLAFLRRAFGRRRSGSRSLNAGGLPAHIEHRCWAGLGCPGCPGCPGCLGCLGCLGDLADSDGQLHAC